MRCLLLLLIPGSWVALPVWADESPSLRFALHSEALPARSLAWLTRSAPARRIRVFEPYEAREVEFEASPLASVLDAIYGDDWRNQPDREALSGFADVDRG